MTPGRAAWLDVLDEEDTQFLRRFLLHSGSLKAVAEEYSVSYPTVRARLDRLIAKARAAEEVKGKDPFDRTIQLWVAEGKLPINMARELIAVHHQSLEERKKT